jgi:small subunit ribosomal protein S15
MARMHSRKGGVAGSTRPLQRNKPSWLTLGEKELELLIVKLFKEGNTPSKIGLTLRDTYGIPDVKAVIGKSITKFLAEKDHQLKLPEDLLALMRRASDIRKHMADNRQDMTGKRGMQLTDAKINRLVKYYKSTGKIPIDFKYNPEQLKMYIE